LIDNVMTPQCTWKTPANHHTFAFSTKLPNKLFESQRKSNVNW